MCINDKNGKNAVTHYKVLERFGNYTYMQFQLETGRTHQIRVHMQYLGYPLVGDYLYNPDMEYINRQALHAYRLSFPHPITRQQMEFVAPMPPDMKKVLGEQE